MHDMLQEENNKEEIEEESNRDDISTKKHYKAEGKRNAAEEYHIDNVSIDTLDREIEAAQCKHECDACSRKLGCACCCECSIMQDNHRLEEENALKEMKLYYEKLNTYLFKNEVAMGEVSRENELQELEKKHRSMNDMLLKVNDGLSRDIQQLHYEAVGSKFAIKHLKKDVEYFKSKSKGFNERKRHENRNRSRCKN